MLVQPVISQNVNSNPAISQPPGGDSLRTKVTEQASILCAPLSPSPSFSWSYFKHICLVVKDQITSLFMACSGRTMKAEDVKVYITDERHHIHTIMTLDRKLCSQHSDYLKAQFTFGDNANKNVFYLSENNPALCATILNHVGDTSQIPVNAENALDIAPIASKYLLTALTEKVDNYLTVNFDSSVINDREGTKAFARDCGLTQFHEALAVQSLLEQIRIPSLLSKKGDLDGSECQLCVDLGQIVPEELVTRLQMQMNAKGPYAGHAAHALVRLERGQVTSEQLIALLPTAKGESQQQFLHALAFIGNTQALNKLMEIILDNGAWLSLRVAAICALNEENLKSLSIRRSLNSLLKNNIYKDLLSAVIPQASRGIPYQLLQFVDDSSLPVTLKKSALDHLTQLNECYAGEVFRVLFSWHRKRHPEFNMLTSMALSALGYMSPSQIPQAFTQTLDNEYFQFLSLKDSDVLKKLLHNEAMQRGFAIALNSGKINKSDFNNALRAVLEGSPKAVDACRKLYRQTGGYVDEHRRLSIQLLGHLSDDPAAENELFLHLDDYPSLVAQELSHFPTLATKERLLKLLAESDAAELLTTIGEELFTAIAAPWPSESDEVNALKTQAIEAMYDNVIKHGCTPAKVAALASMGAQDKLAELYKLGCSPVCSLAILDHLDTSRWEREHVEFLVRVINGKIDGQTEADSKRAAEVLAKQRDFSRIEKSMNITTALTEAVAAASSIEIAKLLAVSLVRYERQKA